jgi:hypothetical protein
MDDQAQRGSDFGTDGSCCFWICIENEKEALGETETVQTLV